MSDEIARLQEAKRRALAIADERSRENVELRSELTRLRELAHHVGLCTCDSGRCHRSDYQCLSRYALTGVKNWAPGGEP